MGIIESVERAGSLNVPARARLYEVVAAAYPGWVTRDQAASEAGISRSLAAFHLEKLAEAGLLDVTARRLGARRGPGAGRPAKLYRRSITGLEVSLPRRDYELAAELLVQAVERAGAGEALGEAARAAGVELAGNEDLIVRLERIGYEPAEAEGVIRLRNCPFHALAQRHSGVVCDMNRALLSGLVQAGQPFRVELEPEPGYCCVVLRRTGRR